MPVQLTNCFSRLWSPFGDLLTLYIVCGGYQPNSRHIVRITRQLSSEEIKRPRNHELGWALYLVIWRHSRPAHECIGASAWLPLVAEATSLAPPFPIHPSLGGLGFGLLQLFDRWISLAADASCDFTQYCHCPPFTPPFWSLRHRNLKLSDYTVRRGAWFESPRFRSVSAYELLRSAMQYLHNEV